MIWLGVAAAAASLTCGCKTGYSWRSNVPHEARTVSVPTFRNETSITELGAVMARQVAREFQREGTFRLCLSDDAALEVQGVVQKTGSESSAYDRRSGLRSTTHDFTSTVLVSVVDRRTGKVVIDNRPYVARATFTAGQDLTTARRDASGRLAQDLARQVVDDVLNLKW